jgi:hypothetical protein
LNYEPLYERIKPIFSRVTPEIDIETNKKISEKIETNARVPHPTLVAVGMGIAMSVLAVLVLTAIDGSFLVQEAEALRSRIKEHEPT